MYHVFYLAAIFFVQFVCFIHCENATSKQEEQDTFYLRVISTNFTKTVKVSRNFINFLKQDLPTFVSEIKGLDIRRMQNDYQTRSLYELFYFFSVTRDCFCYDSGFFDGGSEVGAINFEWDEILDFKKKNTPLDPAIHVNVNQRANVQARSHAEASANSSVTPTRNHESMTNINKMRTTVNIITTIMEKLITMDKYIAIFNKIITIIGDVIGYLLEEFMIMT